MKTVIIYIRLTPLRTVRATLVLYIYICPSTHRTNFSYVDPSTVSKRINKGIPFLLVLSLYIDLYIMTKRAMLENKRAYIKKEEVNN